MTGTYSLVAQTFELAEVIAAGADAQLDRLMTALPGYVESYDPVLGVVDVQPAVVDTYVNEIGEEVKEAFPLVTSVPVVFPGSGPSSITFPIAKGDAVLLIFTCRSIDAFWALGHGGKVIDPRTRQRHHISDAFAIPGVRPRAKAIKPAPPSDAMVLTAPKVKLGGAAASLAPALKRDVDRLKAAFTNSAVLAGIAAAPVDGGTSFTSAFNAYFSTNPLTGAAKVEMEAA